MIIGDTDILATAPYRMSIAGYADLIGKLTALNDWRIAVLANGEHYCQHMDTLVTDYVEKIMAMTDRVRERDPEALGEVFNALLLTGAVISLYGNSRPISGSEHHMSHYWEALGDQQGKAYAMHGEQVAVGTVLSLMMSEALYRRAVDFDAARAKAKAYDKSAWEAEIRRVYGSAAEAIIRLENEADKNGCEGKLKRIDAIEEHWQEIRALLGKAYSSEKLRTALKELGCPADPKDIGIDAVLLRDTFLYCKETRDRYTLYQLLWDLGLMEEVAEDVIRELERREAV